VLLCVEATPVEVATWEDALDALDAVSPLIDDVRPGLAFLEMRGMPGTPPQWIEHARTILDGAHVRVRFGIGANRIAARGAAFTKDGTIFPAGRERALLAPLPLSVLEMGEDVIERLRLLGIERLGDLARLPHGPFVRRFGARAARWHALARGQDTTPFVPRAHVAVIEAALLGEGQAQDEAQVFFALRMLLARIASDLERSGRRAGALELAIELEDAQTHRFDIVLAAPTAQERAMFDVVRAKLEGVTFPAAIVGLRVRAAGLEEGGEALVLLAGDDFDPQAVALTIARLESVLGTPVQRARTKEAHALEDRFSYERFELPKRTVLRDGAETQVEAVVPQLRLLTVAEIPVRLRAGEPALIGDPPRAVLECAGPWRIDTGWPDHDVVRDEYDVLLEDGELYRIYRQGNHWYVRGAYD
jgi:nucleotidyltransferase/DNA polymerase involved in DNA repair